MEKIGGNSEFILLNRTRDTLGPLYNLGNGRTGFKSLSGLGIATKNINGITKSLDTLKLGDSLTQYTYIQSLVHGTNNTRFRALVIGNLPEAQSLNGVIGYNPLFNTYNPATLGLQRVYSTANGDVNLGQYGGLQSTIFRISRDSTDGTFVAGGTNEALPGLGGEFVSQWFPQRDSSVLGIGRDGLSGNELFAQKDIGQSWGYNVNVVPQSGLPAFPLVSIRSSIDFARVIDNTRRKKMTGAGVTGFLSMYKTYQSSITGSTYETGSITDSVFGYRAYGDANPEINLDTKAKALRVWSVNNAFGVFVDPQYRYKNTVRDGYAFVARGDTDLSHLPFLNIGPYSTFPSRANGGNLSFTRRLYVTGDGEVTGTMYALVHQAAGVVVSMPVALATEAVVNFQQKDSSSVTATLGAYLSPSNRFARGGYWRSEIFSAAVMDNTSTGGFLQWETGANHVNITRQDRSGYFAIGYGANTILYRAYKKFAVNGGSVFSLNSGDTLTVKNLPVAPAGDTVNYKPGVYDAAGNLLKGTWSGSSGGGSGTNNANIGSGYRWLNPSTQEIKTFFTTYGGVLDSSTNTNALTLTLDTTLLQSRLRGLKLTDSMVAVNNTRYQAALSGTGLVSFSGTTPSYNTTSSSIAGIISDETGSGAMVFGTTPTFTTNITAPLIYGGSGAAATLTLSSTPNGTKGKILFGTSAYDEVNNRLGITTASPASALDVGSGAVIAGSYQTTSTGVNSNFFTAGTVSIAGTTTSNYLFPGGAGTDFRVAINGTTASTSTAGRDVADLVLTGSVITEAGSSTHPRIGTLFVGRKTITNGAGATDTAFGAYIDGPATGITPTTGSFNTIFNFGNVLVKQGKLGIGINPTAMLHLPASTTAANTASIKLGEGSRQTSAEDGTINYVSNNLEFTETSTVYTLAKTLKATASLDFVSTTTNNSSELTITVTGAATGDPVSLAIPHALASSGTCFTAWVSSSDTVTVRFNNYSGSTIDPSSGSFTAAVIHY